LHRKPKKTTRHWPPLSLSLIHPQPYHLEKEYQTFSRSAVRYLKGYMQMLQGEHTALIKIDVRSLNSVSIIYGC
jgi:hypothetical protein